MSEDKKAYEQSIINAKLEKVGFRLPKSLYQALQLRMKNEGYHDGLGNYYFYLVSYEFYTQYKELFYRVREGLAPIAGSLSISELPNFGVDANQHWHLMEENTEPTPVMIYLLPQTHLEVCRHLGQCINYHKSDSILYRFFTIKILIAKLQNELASISKSANSIELH